MNKLKIKKMNLLKWLFRSNKIVLNKHIVIGTLTPFGESIKLLRELADLQNAAPFERNRQEWEEIMNQVYDFLSRWEGQ